MLAAIALLSLRISADNGQPSCIQLVGVLASLSLATTSVMLR